MATKKAAKKTSGGSKGGAKKDGGAKKGGGGGKGGAKKGAKITGGFGNAIKNALRG
jgi:hypothetical protein